MWLERIAVEFIGELDTRTLGPEDNGKPFIAVLKNKPPSRFPEDAEVIAAPDKDTSTMTIRLGGEERVLQNYDDPIWFELLDGKGYLIRFYILHRFVAVGH